VNSIQQFTAAATFDVGLNVPHGAVASQKLHADCCVPKKLMW
jgi:hypothetical protein